MFNKFVPKTVIYFIAVLFFLVVLRKTDSIIIGGDLQDIFASTKNDKIFLQEDLYKRLENFSVDGNIITSVSNDPMIYIETSNIDDYKYVKINVDLIGTPQTNAQIFYSIDGEEFNESNSVRFILKSGVTSTYLTNKGSITLLRFAPSAESGVSMSVNSVTLTHKFTPKTSSLVILLLFFLVFTVLYWNWHWHLHFLVFFDRFAALRYCLLLLPLVFGFLVITFFGVNIIFWDEWRVPFLIDNVLKNGIKFSDFFAQHNEHRIFFPRIVFLIAGLISHLNSKVFMYISWAFSSIVYLLFVLYINRLGNKKIKNMTTRQCCLAIVLGFCIFSLVQAENIFWGFQIGFIMVGSFAVLSFYFFHCTLICRKIHYLVFSILCALIASFSSLQGLFVLPSIISVMLLLVLSKEKINKKYILCILFSFAVISTLYLYGYHKPEYQPPYFGNSFTNMLLYFFASVGFTLAPQLFGSINLVFTVVLGISIFLTATLLCIYLLIKKRAAKNIFPLCLIFFGIAFCCSITIGRSGFGVAQAFSGRYTTFSLSIITGIILIIYSEFIRNKRLKLILVLGLCTTVALTFFVNINVLSTLPAQSASQKKQQEIIRSYKDSPLEDLGKSYPWTNLDEAHSFIGIIEKHKWSVFYK